MECYLSSCIIIKSHAEWIWRREYFQARKVLVVNHQLTVEHGNKWGRKLLHLEWNDRTTEQKLLMRNSEYVVVLTFPCRGGNYSLNAGVKINTSPIIITSSLLWILNLFRILMFKVGSWWILMVSVNSYSTEYQNLSKVSLAPCSPTSLKITMEIWIYKYSCGAEIV